MKKSVVFVFLLCSMVMSSQTRIMVVSDLHVLDTRLYDNGSAFEAHIAKESKLVEHSYALFDSAMHVVEKERPDILLIPGDLTAEGALSSHYVVHDRLAKLVEMGICVLVVPSNHDISNLEASK